MEAPSRRRTDRRSKEGRRVDALDVNTVQSELYGAVEKDVEGGRASEDRAQPTDEERRGFAAEAERRPEWRVLGRTVVLAPKGSNVKRDASGARDWASMVAKYGTVRITERKSTEASVRRKGLLAIEMLCAKAT
jgi:hypothetical protein